MKNKYYPLLAEPITIRGVTFKNRIFGSPMGTPELDANSCMRREEVAFHEHRASGGVASVCIGLGIVDPIGRSHTKEVTLYDVMSIPSLREAANAMHRHNCKAVMELAHGGKYANARGHAGAAGTAIGPNDEIAPSGLEVRAMTDEDIYYVAEKFAEGAKVSVECGFDMILIHGGHGWLLGQFSSPSMNHRTDKWGGSLENRMRFPLLVCEKVREAVGPKVPIEYRMSGTEYIDGGYDIEEGVAQAKMLDEQGIVDIIHVSAGVHEDPIAFTLTHPSMFEDHGVNVYLAEAVKKEVKNTLVATLGGLSDPDMMEDILATGKADIVEVARQSICDPHFVEKAFSGHKDDIIRCCRCFTCFYNVLTNRTFCCALNPHVGNELRSFSAPPATTPKKVVVVGGGPGGLMAAATAAERGHDVTLFEKNDELGGALLAEKWIPFKADMYNFVKVMSARVERLGVKVELGKEVTAEEVAALEADVVISALGAKPVVPPIPGIDKPIVVGLEALHQEVPQVGDKVVILGGGLVGSECAIYLDGLGKDVTVVEMLDEWAKDAYFMHKNAMIKAVRDTDIKFQVNTKAVEITDEGLKCEGPEGEVFFEADTILLAAGMKSDRSVADTFFNTAPRVFEAGDVMRAGRVYDATNTAYFRALDI
ncbi:MAG: FAD-dependent oxidoreductase [Coriobacteriales bacterium]|jgi:2,4-dienoyl-CoA reductase-like NADH-dependent reductase (Old Yellow Enzyme family)/NADPH-dependent 2,4-dienoyl-CoA reductase/sulfur reductase-like enzyme